MKHKKLTDIPQHFTIATVDINKHSVKLTYDIGRKVTPQDFKATGLFIKAVEAGKL